MRRRARAEPDCHGSPSTRKNAQHAQESTGVLRLFKDRQSRYGFVSAAQSRQRGEQYRVEEGQIDSPHGLPYVKWDNMLPTFAKLAGAKLPEGELDGHGVWPVISGQSETPHPGDFIEQTIGGEFQAIITLDGKWKLHVPHGFRTMVGGTPGRGGAPGKYQRQQIGYALFDMVNDPMESTNVIKDQPEVAGKLVEAAEKHRQKWFPKQEAFSWDYEAR